MSSFNWSLIGSRDYEVGMVRHEAIGPHLDRSLAALLGEQIAIERVVGCSKKVGWRRLPRCVT
jgi:hypothetical protein